MSRLSDTLEEILQILDQLEIHYAIGGSIASGVHGLARATMDIDIVANVTLENLTDLVELAGGRFYMDEPSARNAIQLGRSFNLIHNSTIVKVDIFPAAGNHFRESEIFRREFGEFRFEDASVECAITSVEDTILAKLTWHKQSGSARQWEDLLGMLEVTKEIDLAYLESWAARLQVRDLLTRLLTEASLER